MKRSFIIFLHLGYWFLYLLICLLIFGSMMARMPNQHITVSQVLKSIPFMMGVVPSVLSFYGFYFLVFRYLKFPIKVLHLILVSLGVILGSSFVAYSLLLLINIGFWQSVFEGHVAMLLIMSILGLIHGILASIIRGFLDWYENLKINAALTKKNFDMEMSLIKSQLDPHFLFNTISNIDVLIGKNPEKASAYLNKLSDIMRFMLYETKTERILLKKEWAYLEKYIELQKIRTSNLHFVKYSIEGNLENVMIAPMVFIPFVENAFKYADGIRLENAIEVSIQIAQNEINFYCKNHYFPKQNKTPNEFGGLGNELINKRLALIYADKHTLEIKDEKEVYEVFLKINI